MKIGELLEDDQRVKIPPADIPIRNSSKYSLTNDIQDKRSKRIGKGARASVFKHPKDPSKVVKYVQIYDDNPRNDAYVQYVDLAMKNRDNPFFPRIYKAKMVRHANRESAYTLVLTMEKLQPLANLDDINDKLEFSTSQLIKRLGIPISNPVSGVYDLDYWLNDASNRNNLKRETKNPQLKQALELMEPFWRVHMNDLHNENFMVRLTKSGPQLVFVDPFESY